MRTASNDTHPYRIEIYRGDQLEQSLGYFTFTSFKKSCQTCLAATQILTRLSSQSRLVKFQVVQ